MKKTKILILKFSYEKIGGVDRQILRLSKRLNNTDDFEVILVTNNSEFPLTFEFKRNGGRVINTSIKESSIAKAVIDVLRIVKYEKISVIQSHLFRESVICRFVKLFNPKIKHIFRVQTFIDCAWISNSKKSFYHLFDFFSSFLVNKYIANGPVVYDEIIDRSWISKRKVVNIINGCEQIGIYNYDILKSKPINRFQIAMVANLMEKKGFEILIDSISILKKRNYNCKVKIFGAEISGGVFSGGYTSYKNKLIELTIEKDVFDNIQFCDYTYNIYEALIETDIVVLPSDSEGVPNCLIESMSVGKLVIASSVGAVPFIIRPGINGFLHPPQRSDLFANEIIKIIELPEGELLKIIQNAYETWNNEFNLDIMVKKIIEIYKSILI
jgi:glycosyltransferase involved in cell wall biosynthesis